MGEDIHPYGAAGPCSAGSCCGGSAGHAAVTTLLRKLVGSSAGTERETLALHSY